MNRFETDSKFGDYHIAFAELAAVRAYDFLGVRFPDRAKMIGERLRRPVSGLESGPASP